MVAHHCTCCVHPERWAAFATVAGVSQTEKVLVTCRGGVVRRQYERAIPKLGGNLGNVIFHILGGRDDGFAEQCPPSGAGERV